MKAAHLCKGELIAFCDQDDVWREDKLNICQDLFSDERVMLCYHSAVVINASGKAMGRYKPFPYTAKLPFDFFSFPNEWFSSLGFTQVFRRKLIEISDDYDLTMDHNDSDQPMAHDQWVFFLASISGVISYIDQDLVAYRQHDSNVDGWSGRRLWLKRAFGVTRKLDGYSSHGIAAACRASVAEKLGDQLSFGRASAPMSAASVYRRLEHLYNKRSLLYGRLELKIRFQLFCDLVFDGAYKSFSRGGLGKVAFLRDMILFFMFSHRPV